MSGVNRSNKKEWSERAFYAAAIVYIQMILVHLVLSVIFTFDSALFFPALALMFGWLFAGGVGLMLHRKSKKSVWIGAAGLAVVTWGAAVASFYLIEWDDPFISLGGVMGVTFGSLILGGVVLAFVLPAVEPRSFDGRCPDCRYALAGLDPEVHTFCPECGVEIGLLLRYSKPIEEPDAADPVDRSL